MPNLLVEYVRSILTEFTLISPKEIDRRSEPALYDAMIELDLKLIPSGKDDGETEGFVGEGAYGRVYEVLYKKRRCALKITYNDEDANGYSGLMSIYGSLPQFVKRSLPKIYVQKKLPQGAFATVTEFLVQPSDSLLQTAWRQGAHFNVAQKQARESFANEFLDAIIRDTTPEIYAKLKNDSRWTSYKKNAKTVLDFAFSSELWQKLEDILGKQHQDQIDQIVSKADEEYKKYIPNAYRFPRSGGSHSARQKIDYPEDPRVKHLLLSLRWLVQKGYLTSWDDVHQNNVMIRASTGDIVVADLGMFLW